MKFEFPTILYAHALQNTTADGATCDDIYSSFGFTADQATALCANVTFMDMSGISGFYNLLTVYFYGNVFNPQVMA